MSSRINWRTKEKNKEGQENSSRERHQNAWPKWQCYVGIGGRGVCKLDKFRVGSRVRGARESQDASLHSVTEEVSTHFDMLIGTTIIHLS